MNNLAHAPTVLAVDQTKLAACRTAGEQILTALTNQSEFRPDHEQTLADYLQRVQVILTDLEDEREQMVRPLLNSKSEVDKLFKAARTPWESVKQLCKDRIAKAQECRLRDQEQVRLIAEAAAARGDVAACSEALAAIPESKALDGASVSWEWAVKDTDVSKMDPHLLLPDMKALERICKMAKGQSHPPAARGVEFHKVAKVRVK